MILIAIPAIALASSRNSNPKTKIQNENKIVENIQKQIERPEPIGEMEKGEYPAPESQKMPVMLSKPTSLNIDAKMFIYLHESGNNPWAVNPTSGACGLAQALPCSKMNCQLGDYACQDAWATHYMLGRYGTWANARYFWEVHRYW